MRGKELNITGERAHAYQKLKNKECHQFFITELAKIYGMEKQLAEFILPLKFSETSLSEMIRTFLGFERQMKVIRLQQVFMLLSEDPITIESKAIISLADKLNGLNAESCKSWPLLLTISHVLHAKISSYGCLEVFAEQMNRTDIAALLKTTLIYEKELLKNFSAAFSLI